MMRAAPQPKFPAATMTQARVRSCSPRLSTPRSARASRTPIYFLIREILHCYLYPSLVKCASVLYSLRSECPRCTQVQ